MELQLYIGEIPGPGRLVEISDSNELCIVELMRADCSIIKNNIELRSLFMAKKFSKTYFCWKCLRKINSINDISILFIFIYETVAGNRTKKKTITCVTCYKGRCWKVLLSNNR